MSSWKHKHTVPDGTKFKIKGINVWDYEWSPTGERIIVTDPLYNQEHTMVVYEVKTKKKTIKFAAGEFSNCVWGFYTETVF